MNRLRWRALLATGFMLAGALLTYLGKPTIYLADRVGKPDLEAVFPKEFAGWRLDAGPLIVVASPEVQAQLNVIYDQVLGRSYVNAQGQRIMLSVAYGGDQSDGMSAHRPEVCYPAQGYAITSNEKGVQGAAGGQLAVRRLMSQQGTRSEPITYWIVVGNEVATTGIEQKLAQMRYGLRGVIADGMLVRVSSLDVDMDKAHAVQAGFIADLAAAMTDPMRTRVFGTLAF